MNSRCRQHFAMRVYGRFSYMLFFAAARGGKRPRACLATARRGGVLMEYVLVTAVTMAFIVGISGMLFDPGTGAFTVEGAIEGRRFGVLGDAFADMFETIMKGIALPIP